MDVSKNSIGTFIVDETACGKPWLIPIINPNIAKKIMLTPNKVSNSFLERLLFSVLFINIPFL